jgi:hypothetical protein
MIVEAAQLRKCRDTACRAWLKAPFSFQPRTSPLRDQNSGIGLSGRGAQTPIENFFGDADLDFAQQPFFCLTRYAAGTMRKNLSQQSGDPEYIYSLD